MGILFFNLELLDRDQEYFRSQLESEKALRADISTLQRDNHEKIKTINRLNERINFLSGRLEKLEGFLPIKLSLKIYRKLTR